MQVLQWVNLRIGECLQHGSAMFAEIILPLTPPSIVKERGTRALQQLAPKPFCVSMWFRISLILLRFIKMFSGIRYSKADQNMNDRISQYTRMQDPWKLSMNDNKYALVKKYILSSNMKYNYQTNQIILVPWDSVFCRKIGHQSDLTSTSKDKVVSHHTNLFSNTLTSMKHHTQIGFTSHYKEVILDQAVLSNKSSRSAKPSGLNVCSHLWFVPSCVKMKKMGEDGCGDNCPQAIANGYSGRLASRNSRLDIEDGSYDLGATSP
ncbi:hypothetical protein M5K25_022447 [Dendrobium thyrsiflorum]|uniref:Uncharacterized protein n=1 Tax=Dendrobium thyrsiflorum TaxID=117978 RepID=A0ABD0UCA6_DENTH